MRRIYDIVQLILIICIGIIVLGVCGAKLLFHITPHIVLSGSMDPAISTGSLCFVDERLKTPKKGDIIAFSKGNLLVTHRVVGISGKFYITKGDRNNARDSAAVSYQELVGTTVFWIPAAGYAAAFLQSKRGMIVTITAFILFILIGYMLPVKKEGGIDEG